MPPPSVIRSAPVASNKSRWAACSRHTRRTAANNRSSDGRNHLPELRRREMTLGLPRRAAGSLRTTHILRSALGRTGYSIVMATEVGVMNASVSRSCSSGRYACQC